MDLKTVLDLKQSLSNLWPKAQLIAEPETPIPQDLRVFRKGIPRATPTLPTIEGFLFDNLRGPAMKHGPTAVFGWSPLLAIVADRARLVHLFETDFIRVPIMDGVSIKRPPKLPNNVFWMNDPGMPSFHFGYGAAVLFKSSESDTIGFVPGARIMGPLQNVKDHLRGRKFFIRNRFSDNVCVELV